MNGASIAIMILVVIGRLILGALFKKSKNK